MKKRIGNDIHFVWHIYRKDGDTQVPESFADKDVTIKLISPLQRTVTIEDVSIATGVVTFTFRGKHQVTLGNYVAVLLENKGENGMVTLDVVNAVTLVPHSYMEEDGDEGDVIEAEAVELESETGQGIDAYTKAETDALLEGKYDKVDGIRFLAGQRWIVVMDENYHAATTISPNEVQFEEVNGTEGATFWLNGGYLRLNDKYHTSPTGNKIATDLELAGKQDTINDLAAIRNGATLGATAYQKPATGIPATDLASDVQTDLAAIDGIEEVIPTQASSSNQLADKNFVNSSIATNTANYISDNGQPFQSLEDLEAYSGVLTNNDYAFVVGVDSAGNTTYSRYKYNASTQQWALEYVLNNSSFTAEQWAAINSSITSGLVTKLSALPTNSELATLLNGKASKDLLDEVIRKAYMDAYNSEIITDSDNMKHFILSGTGTLEESGLYTTSRYANIDTFTRTIGGIVYEKTIKLSGFSTYPTFYIHCPFSGQLYLSILTDDYARFTIVGHHYNELHESSFVGTIEVDAGEDISITHRGSEKRIFIGEIKLTYKDYLERTTTITLLNSKVDKVTGKGLSANDYTDSDKGKLNDLPTATELAQELGGKANSADLAEVATSGSYNDLSNKPDLSGFITNSVDNLVNYYLKSETYTKTEVLQLIGAIQQFHYEVYPTLPQTGASNVLYLIGPTGTGTDKYEEYVYANNDWTKIGDTSIDLSGYVTTQALNTALADYVTSSALSTILSSYVNKDEIDDVPTANSKNPVTSGGVYGTTPSIKNTDAESDLDISDEDENVLMRLSGGHIKTKNFDSVLFSRINSDVDYDNEVVATTSANSTLLYQQHKSIGSFNFDFKWVGGCLAENGRIYGITNGNRQVLEINPETDTYCLFGNLSSGSFKWSGCGIWKNGKIYGYPRSANSVLIIDPLTQGVEEVDLGTNYEPNHHYGGCIVGDYMYLAPRAANHILKINLKTWQIERLGEDILTDITRYSTCIYHPNGYIYFIPEYNAKVLKLNPLNDAITELGSVLQSCSVYGASVAPNNKCIYGFTNRTNGGILKIDVVNNDTISFIHEGTVGTGYYSTELALNGKLYSGVGNGTDVWELDPTNDTVTIVDTISDTVGGDYNEAKCAGGVLAENGSIYLIPAKGRHIYKLEFDGQVVRTMPRKVLMSNYFSNY